MKTNVNHQVSSAGNESLKLSLVKKTRTTLFRRILLWCGVLALVSLAGIPAGCTKPQKKIFYGRNQGLANPELRGMISFGKKDSLANAKVGEMLEITLVGTLTKRPNPNRKGRYIWDLESFFGKDFSVRLNDFGEINQEPYLDAHVLVTATGEVVRGEAEPVPVVKTVTRIHRRSDEEVTAFEAEAERAAAEAAKGAPRGFDPSPNAKPFSGTWGIRVPLPSAMWEDQLNAFDVKAFSDQFTQLTSASHVIVNVTHPAKGAFFVGPHPELAKIVGPEPFPTRDLLGEVLDAIIASGKKALVYFACGGFHGREAAEETKVAWDTHIESLDMYHVEAVRELILTHYAQRYGEKISGWWFDGAKAVTASERPKWKAVILAANPKAIISFNSMAGPPYSSKPECHYFGGHPTPRKLHPFWNSINLPMITDIEKGPWMGTKGAQVEPGYGALGHVFMGLQDRWTGGPCKFPPEQAFDWTARVLKAGGMYTWAVPRLKTGNISLIRGPQFELLLKINEAVEKMRSGKE